MTPSNVVSSFVRHMKIESKIGLSTLGEAAKANLPALLTRLRALKPSRDEVSGTLEYLSTDECTFSQEQTIEIAEVVKSTMVEHATIAAKTVVKTQHHLHLHNYLPMKLWGAPRLG